MFRPGFLMSLLAALTSFLAGCNCGQPMISYQLTVDAAAASADVLASDRHVADRAVGDQLRTDSVYPQDRRELDDAHRSDSMIDGARPDTFVADSVRPDTFGADSGGIEFEVTKVTITFDGFGPWGAVDSEGLGNWPYYIGDAYKKYGGVDVLFGATSDSNPETNYFDLADDPETLWLLQQGWHTVTQNPNYPSHSGENAAQNSGAGGPIIFGTPVSNVGAFFNNYSTDLTFSAYDINDSLLGSIVIPSTIQPTPGGPIYYELHYENISYVTFSNGPRHMPNYHLDDLQFEIENEVNPFPDQFLPGSAVAYPENNTDHE